MRSTILVCLLSLSMTGCGRDGRLIDNGVGTAHWRYILDLGPVRVDQNGTSTFQIGELPGAKFVIGLEVQIDPPEPDIRSLSPLRATAEVQLTKSDGTVLFTEKAPLQDWTWNVPGDGSWAFIYRKGEHGTSFTAEPGVRYTLQLSISDTSGEVLAYPVSLYAKAGGWK